MSVKEGNKPLSFRAIEVMKPGDRVKADTGENRGLRLNCGNAGTKTFFYRYTSPVTNKQTQIKIGNFPTVSLAEARIRLQELKVERKAGKCPAAELKSKKQELAKVKREEQSRASFTITAMIDLYLEQYIEDRRVKGRIIPGARKPKGQAEVRRTLYSDPVRILGKKSAAETNRKQIISLIMGIIERGSNVQAGNVLRELSAAYEYAIGVGRFDDDFANPALLAKAGLKQAKIKLTPQRGKRTLSDTELGMLLKWLPGSTYTATQKHVLRFALWTGSRTGEVCNAIWKDIDLDKKVWRISQSKTGIERYVQLPDQAIDFLVQLKMSTGDCLFPSQKTGLPLQQKQLTEQAWRMRKAGSMLDIDRWTPHDLRRSVRTGLSRLQCRNEVAEAILGHARGGIEGTYDLHAYEAECREWLQIWADHLDGLLQIAQSNGE